MNYAEQRLDPRWQKCRLGVLSRYHFTCEGCGATDKTLHVHHKYYVSHRLPWEYPDFCFQCLCVDCHSALKEAVEERRIGGGSIFDEWEAGLDWFGDRLFDLFMEEAIAKDFDEAHKLPTNAE